MFSVFDGVVRTLNGYDSFDNGRSEKVGEIVNARHLCKRISSLPVLSVEIGHIASENQRIAGNYGKSAVRTIARRFFVFFDNHDRVFFLFAHDFGYGCGISQSSAHVGVVKGKHVDFSSLDVASPYAFHLLFGEHFCVDDRRLLVDIRDCDVLGKNLERRTKRDGHVPFLHVAVRVERVSLLRVPRDFEKRTARNFAPRICKRKLRGKVVFLTHGVYEL